MTPDFLPTHMRAHMRAFHSNASGGNRLSSTSDSTSWVGDTRKRRWCSPLERSSVLGGWRRSATVVSPRCACARCHACVRGNRFSLSTLPFRSKAEFNDWMRTMREQRKQLPSKRALQSRHQQMKTTAANHQYTGDEVTRMVSSPLEGATRNAPDSFFGGACRWPTGKR